MPGSFCSTRRRGSGSTVTDKSDVLPKTIDDRRSRQRRLVDGSLTVNTADRSLPQRVRLQGGVDVRRRRGAHCGSMDQHRELLDGKEVRRVSSACPTNPWVRNFMLGPKSQAPDAAHFRPTESRIGTMAARRYLRRQEPPRSPSPTSFISIAQVVRRRFTSTVLKMETFTRMGGLSQWDATYPIIVANEGRTIEDGWASST